jgi:triphosphoribosyl-dephospho-CoA synthase
MDAALPAAHAVAAAFEAACLAELQALKPGNVHIYGAGHNMVVDDFVKSAHAAAGVIARPGLGVGQRIFEAIEATWSVVDCNTNLGIVLLAAPLVESALTGKPLQEVLQGLTREDADYAFRAIVRASPAGLGDSARHDVREPPQVTLLEAMQEAAPCDRIACHYASGYDDIFRFAVPRYRFALEKWGSPLWATSAVYLGWLAHLPDSHIVRKYGEAVAASVVAKAEPYERMLLKSPGPDRCLDALLDLDSELKREGINPGTSADLTVATLFAISIEKYLQTV